jgi:hypothetical protein
MNMPFSHAKLTLASLGAALFATSVAGAGSRAAPANIRDTGVGPVIAEQGNQALLQIRRELQVLLHDQRPRNTAPDPLLSGSLRHLAPPLNVTASAGSGR